MCQRRNTRRGTFSSNFQSCAPSLLKGQSVLPSDTIDSVYDAWLSSRAMPGHNAAHLVPGSQRPFNRTNIILAYVIIKNCTLNLFRLLWGIHPIRTTLMFSLNIIRSLFPAFRGYSQALIIDELQSLVSSGHFTWSRLIRLLVTEILRRIMESLLDSFAMSNENLVHSSARFLVEYQQMEQRIRLDLPTLEDPIIRDLLRESDLFARSFSGMGGFGLLSPFDFINILALVSELASHALILFSVTGATNFGALLLSVLSAMLPLVMKWSGFSDTHSETLYSAHEARTAERQEKLRNLAYSDVHRPEIILFGLGPWILRSWANVRKTTLDSDLRPSMISSGLSITILSHINFADLLFALQNIPLVLILQSSSASLGSLALYRSSIQSAVFTIQNLLTTTRMAYQGVFLMGAFCAAAEIQPRLQPKDDKTIEYRRLPRGVRIQARNLSYTYPGSKEPCLKDISFKLEAGETLAIVGYNGSGKSTLAKIILRILEFDDGELLVNDVDIRRLSPLDYHRRLTAVFQGFSKFSATVKENVGIGQVQKLGSRAAVEHSIRLAGAENIIDSLPHGLRTKLNAPGGFESMAYSPFPENLGGSVAAHPYHGLSGGEWQRIAISRAFMRVDEPEIDLLVFDEPTSSLDPHAQNSVFDTIKRISRSPTDERLKTVIFITHRLSTARRADKIAMMESGTISEFGSHEDLLSRGGSYASLYRASV